MSSSILLVANGDPDLTVELIAELRQAKLEPCVVHSGKEGIRVAERCLPDLIVLDMSLWDMNGMDLCRMLQQNSRTSHIPVVMVSELDDEPNRVAAFELGVADYVLRPFSVKELTLRICAIVRRTEGMTPKDVSRVGLPVTLDRASYRVYASNRPVPLSQAEFRLLEALINGNGRTLRREQLASITAGEDRETSGRSVDVHITRLRRKLGSAASIIETVRGIGYRLGSFKRKQDPPRMVALQASG